MNGNNVANSKTEGSQIVPMAMNKVLGTLLTDILSLIDFGCFGIGSAIAHVDHGTYSGLSNDFPGVV